MYMCTSKFEVEEDRLAFTKEHLSCNDDEVIIEVKEENEEGIFDPICDTEEDEESDKRHSTS